MKSAISVEHRDPLHFQKINYSQKLQIWKTNHFTTFVQYISLLSLLIILVYSKFCMVFFFFFFSSENLNFVSYTSTNSHIYTLFYDSEFYMLATSDILYSTSTLCKKKTFLRRLTLKLSCFILRMQSIYASLACMSALLCFATFW